MTEKKCNSIEKLIKYFEDNPKLSFELVKGMLKALYLFAFTLGLSFGAVIAYLIYIKIFS